MKNQKTIFILLGILAVLCLSFFLLKSQNTQKDNQTQTVPTLENLNVTDFSYENSSGSYAFSKEKDTWICQQAPGCDVMQDAVTEFLDTVSQLTVTRILEDPDALADYGLDQPDASLTLSQGSGDLTLSFAAGNGVEYMTIHNENAVYVLSSIPSQLDYTTLDWLDTPSLPYIRSENITSLSFDGYTFVRESAAVESETEGEADQPAVWQITQPDGVRQTQDEPEVVSDELTILSNLYFDSCVDFNVTEASQLAAYGLEQPAHTFRLTSTDPDTQKTSYTLKMGAADSDGNTYVMMDDNGYVCLLSAELTDSLLDNFQLLVSALR